jgi:rhamnose utilization protein RhaD (predicted bifunctional aldolase and dehydrogenase)/NAD(P)-dependent dehydrogenase (short-subunit alcohol dehydrogenase family)
MKSLWSDKEAKKHKGDLGLRVYTSRLLGADPELVLHGGGNTSVKTSQKDFFGEKTDILSVKGSGWDLGTIEKAGFAPVRMDALMKMAALKQLSDSDMVLQQRAAMLNPNAPNPSIEAIVHVVIPQKFVDHTHANAVVALTNTPGGRKRIEEVYGDRILILPYVMPGFVLAREVYKLTQKHDFTKIDGLVLMNHGIFTFHDDARRSYELMIELVTMAERYLRKSGGSGSIAKTRGKIPEDLVKLATIRKAVADQRGCPVLARLDQSRDAVGFSNIKNVASLATRGPLTPDHVIRTKRIPAIIKDDPAKELAEYAREYRAYFRRNKRRGQTMLDPAPRWVVWPGHGAIAFGTTENEAGIVADITEHTRRTVQLSEAVSGWKALPEERIFEIEYWELEQAKLRKEPGSAPLHQGKVALVTGSAAGIGFACAQVLAEQGAQVIGLDLNPEIAAEMEKIGGVGMVVNLTDEKKVTAAVEETVRRFGGIDMVVSNAGIFTAGAYLEDMDQSNWEKSIAVNLTSHQLLLKHTIPFLKLGIDPAIVLVGSRNVNAPGAGAASYSCAKAGLMQLCRVAALELAPFGARCNIIHPDAVFDTKLWTPENLKRSAERYGMTIEEYKTRNLLKTEIRSRDVGEMVSAMASPLFGKTTGAQVPVDGGNDRVI